MLYWDIKGGSYQQAKENKLNAYSIKYMIQAFLSTPW